MRKPDLHIGGRVSLKVAERSGTVARIGGQWVTVAWDDGEAYKVNIRRLRGETRMNTESGG